MFDVDVKADGQVDEAMGHPAAAAAAAAAVVNLVPIVLVAGGVTILVAYRQEDVARRQVSAPRFCSPELSEAICSLPMKKQIFAGLAKKARRRSRLPILGAPHFGLREVSRMAD